MTACFLFYFVGGRLTPDMSPISEAERRDEQARAVQGGARLSNRVLGEMVLLAPLFVLALATRAFSSRQVLATWRD